MTIVMYGRTYRYSESGRQPFGNDVDKNKPEVVENSGCVGIFRRDEKFTLRRGKNERPKRFQNKDVIRYADDMYDNKYIPEEEAKTFKYTLSRTGSTGVYNSLELNNPEKSLGFESFSARSKSKVSFETDITPRFTTSSSNYSTSKHTHDIDSYSGLQRKRLLESKQNTKMLLSRKALSEENSGKLTRDPADDSDNCILTNTDDNFEEINNIVQDEIRIRYTYDSFKRKTSAKCKNKLYSSKPQQNAFKKDDHDISSPDIGCTIHQTEDLSGMMGDICNTNLTSEKDGDAQVTEEATSGSAMNSKSELKNKEKLSSTPEKSSPYDEGLDIYVIMKRKRFAQMEKMESINTAITKSLQSDQYQEISVENGSNEGSDIEITTSKDYDDNFDIDYYQTAVIFDAQNSREEPESVVVVTGHVQGLDVREFPRERLQQTTRSFYQYSDDGESKVLTKPIAEPKSHLKLKKKREIKQNNKAKGKAHMVRVGGGWMKVEHHRNHHTPLKIYEIPRDANDDKFLYIKSRFNPNKKEVPIAYKKYREEIVRG